MPDWHPASRPGASVPSQQSLGTPRRPAGSGLSRPPAVLPPRVFIRGVAVTTTSAPWTAARARRGQTLRLCGPSRCPREGDTASPQVALFSQMDRSGCRWRVSPEARAGRTRELRGWVESATRTPGRRGGGGEGPARGPMGCGRSVLGWRALGVVGTGPPLHPMPAPRPLPHCALMEPHASSIFYLILCVHVFLLLPYKLLEAGTMSDLSCYPPHGLAEVLSQRIYLLNKCLQN